MLDFRLVIAMIGAVCFYGFPVLLLVFLFLLIQTRRKDELAPPLPLVAGWLLGVSTLGVTLFLLSGGMRLMAVAWAALIVFVAALALCGRLLKGPLPRPLRIASWVLLFDTLVVMAFVPFAVWIANEALRVSAYNSTDESAVRAALIKNPDDAAAYSSLGHIDQMRGDRVGAMKEWRQVLRVEPDNLDALLLLSSGLAHEGRMDEARPLFQRLAARNDYFSDNARKWLARHSRL